MQLLQLAAAGSLRRRTADGVRGGEAGVSTAIQYRAKAAAPCGVAAIASDGTGSATGPVDADAVADGTGGRVEGVPSSPEHPASAPTSATATRAAGILTGGGYRDEPGAGPALWTG